MNIHAACSRHFTYEQLFHCGETWKRHGFRNCPTQQSSWVAYADLATEILDPLVDQFGMPTLTFGFCGAALLKEIRKNRLPGIAPRLDQHSASETNRNGKFICSRQGAAVDFIYSSLSSYEIAEWLAKNTPFDRMYFYGNERPLHISYGPDHTRQIVLVHTKEGHRRPQVVSIQKLQDLVTC
jgi:hypothetical protein